MPYVYSTITNDICFVDYRKQRDLNIAIRKIVIKGGHGRAQPGTIYTPFGVATQITDDELTFLEKQRMFNKHVKDGFLIVDNKKSDPENYAKDMNQKDGSAPLTPKDYEESESSTTETKVYKKKK